ncbi:MAG: glycine cleavage system protein GcvH [Dehalococcoidia bacterium]
MVIPPDLRYTKEHEWVRVQDGIATVGITDYAQDQLGDIVFVELPQPGKQLTRHAVFGEIESVKAVSELYSPISGEVVESNQALADKPELANDSPYGEGWIIKVRLTAEAEIDELLSADQYSEFIEQQEE